MRQSKLEEYFEKTLQDESKYSFDQGVKKFLIDYVLVEFKHGLPIQSSLSRHAILHGADTRYGMLSGMVTFLGFSTYKTACTIMLPHDTYYMPSLNDIEKYTRQLLQYYTDSGSLVAEKKTISEFTEYLKEKYIDYGDNNAGVNLKRISYRTDSYLCSFMSFIFLVGCSIIYFICTGLCL